MVYWKIKLALTRGEDGWIGMQTGEDAEDNLAHMFQGVKGGMGNPPTGGDPRQLC